MVAPVIQKDMPNWTAPIVDANGVLTPTWQRMFIALWSRTGYAPGIDGQAIQNEITDIEFDAGGAAGAVAEARLANAMLAGQLVMAEPPPNVAQAVAPDLSALEFTNPVPSPPADLTALFIMSDPKGAY